MRFQSISLLVVLAFASSAEATTYAVTNIASSGPGSLLQAMIDSNATPGGTHSIAFVGGFPDNGVILLNASLPQIQSQSLTVAGGSKRPRIDGQSAHTLFLAGVNTDRLELFDLVVQNGLAAEHGACVSSGNSASTGIFYADHVTFNACRAEGPSLINGGAIFWSRANGSVALIDSELIDNTVTATASNGSSSGGAVFTSGDLTVLRTLFQSNAALATSTGGGIGGAVALVGSGRNSSIVESTFRFNGASAGSTTFGYGGAVYIGCDNCTAQVSRSYLRGNSANYGGAVYARKSSAGAADVFVSLANSTFYNSSVVNQGGAIWINGGASLSASNNTIYNGDASSGAHMGFGTNAQVNYFRANLLAPTFSGTACSGSPTVTNPGFVNFNLLSDASCVALSAGALNSSPLGVIAVDESPGLIGVIRFTGSAVIDSITNGTICEPRDARFQLRPTDGDGDGNAYCDVGAYEYLSDTIFIDGFES